MLKVKPEVKLPENLYLGWLFCAASDQGEAFNFDPGYYVPDEIFAGRTEIRVATIPDWTATVSRKMFANCINLKTVYFRSWENWWKEKEQSSTGGVTRSVAISAGMFENCVTLSEVIFSSVSLECGGGVEVREYAFFNCTALRNISFPGFLECVRKNADWNKTVVVVIGENAFTNCFNFGLADENQVIEYREERS